MCGFVETLFRPVPLSLFLLLGVIREMVELVAYLGSKTSLTRHQSDEYRGKGKKCPAKICERTTAGKPGQRPKNLMGMGACCNTKSESRPVNCRCGTLPNVSESSMFYLFFLLLSLSSLKRAEHLYRRCQRSVGTAFFFLWLCVSRKGATYRAVSVAANPERRTSNFLIGLPWLSRAYFTPLRFFFIL